MIARPKTIHKALIRTALRVAELPLECETMCQRAAPEERAKLERSYERQAAHERQIQKTLTRILRGER